MSVRLGQPDPTPEFFAGGGEMGSRMRAHDWSITPLGPAEYWPQSLRTAVSIMLNSRHPMFLAWGPKLAFLYNDGYIPIFGARHPHTLGRPFAEIWAEIWDDIRPLVECALSGKATWAEDMHLIMRRNGYPEDTWYTFSYSPIRDESGGIGGMFCACTETTAKVLAERRLKFQLDLSERLRHVIDPMEVTDVAAKALARHLNAARVGYGEIDTSQRFISVARDWISGDMPSLAGNSYELQHFGAAVIDDLRAGRTLRLDDTALDPRSAAVDTAYLDIRARSMVIVPLIREGMFAAVLYVHEAQPRRWSDDEAALIEDTAQRTWSAVEHARAGQERRAAEEALNKRLAAEGEYLRQSAEALRESEARLRLALQAARLSEVTFFPSTGGVAHSRSYAALLGFDPERTLTMADIRGCCHPDDLERLMAERDAVLSGDETFFDVEHRIVRPDGALRWIYGRGEVQRGELGAPLSVIAVYLDVTEQREAEQRLRESEAQFRATLESRVEQRSRELRVAEEALRHAQKIEAVGQLTGGIAHDFNNLLTGIIGSLDIVRRRLTSGRLGDVDRFMDAAVTSANRAAGLTHRLLAFSRRQTLDPRPIEVNRLVASMEDLLRRTLSENVSLTMALDPDLWMAEADANQVESALLNLVINARDAMPGGGRLTVQTGNTHLDAGYAQTQEDLEPGDYVMMGVSDTGTGMPQSVLERAFDPFFTTKPIGQGTGLGLSMIYGFAKQSRGHVRIDSAVGEGTAVKLYLPRFHGAAGAMEESVAADVPRARAGETVLVVEDDSAVRMLVVEVLRELGYLFIEAVNASAAIPVLQSGQRIDLLISDIGLPGMNGRQLAELARGVRPELRVLFMTGYADDADVRAGLLEPGMDMITKPFALDALAGKLREIL